MDNKVESLEKDLKKLYSAIDSSTNHIILTDIDGKITYANKAAQQITGYSFEEMKGKTPRLWGGLMPKEFYDDMWRIIKIEQKPYIGEIKNKRKNGEIYTAIIHVSQIYEDNKLVGFIGTEEDITKLKKSEELVEEERAKLEASMLAIGDGLVLTDKDGYITMVNESFTKMLGWDKEEVLGKKLVNIVPLLDKNQTEIALTDRLINEAIQQKETFSSSLIGETYYIRKDKTTIPVYIIVSPILYKGESMGAVEVFRDISKEKDIERAKTEFLSLASHQLRTPLSVINWYFELLQNSKPENLTHLQSRYLLEIYKASQNMVELVNVLLNISRIEMGTLQMDVQTLTVLPITQGIIKEYERTISKKNLEVKLDIPEDAVIRCDRSLFKIVLQNLISNAVKYTGDNGIINIKTSASANENHITISDNGYGIPEDQQAFIFEKMFRARNIKDKVAEGTGMGLYLVRKVIDSLNGKIKVESKENEGSSFTVSLPKL